MIRTGLQRRISQIKVYSITATKARLVLGICNKHEEKLLIYVM